MGQKRIFNYDYLDDVRNIVDRHYNLYFVLLGDKYQIKRLIPEGRILNILCVNKHTMEEFIVPYDLLLSLGAKDINCLNVEIADLGNKIHIEYSELGVIFLRENFPEIYVQYLDIVRQNGKFYLDIHVANLIDMLLSNENSDFVRKYKVLYIGQTKKENIFERLENHSTIQKIHRDVCKKYRDKELYILLSGVQCKAFTRERIERHNTELIVVHPLGDHFVINDLICENEVIDIVEALLISNFKPEYNRKMLDAKMSLKTYSCFKEGDIERILFSIDLDWEPSKERSILFTDATLTTTKSRVIVCNYKDNDVEIITNDV